MSEAFSTLWASIVRTLTPIIVGAIVGWIVARGIPVDAEFQASITIAITAVFQAVYYVAVRLLERYVTPKLGWLLGLAKSPDSYSKPAAK